MSSPPPDAPRPAAPTSHRKTRSGSDALRRLAPPLAAVAAVVVVVLLLVVLNSRPSKSGPAPGAVAQPPTSSTTAALSSPPILGTTSPSPSASRVLSVPVSEPPATQPPATQPPATQAAGRPAVMVLNNSRRSGLAAHVAGEVRAKGWSVAKTGNFRGRIVETTLYYAPGQHTAAAELAHQLPQIRRVAPRFAGLPGSGLTLVVTRDWSG